MLVVAPEGELPAARLVWGTGDWLPPEKREALDWLTLARLLGWGVEVTYMGKSALGAEACTGRRWIILACEPGCLGEEVVGLLAKRLMEEPILVVARAGAGGQAIARLAGAARNPERIAGRSLVWMEPGPGHGWRCRKSVEASALRLSEEASVWATLEDAPVVVARKVGRGLIATLGFHPSQARDIDRAVTALLRHLLIWGSTAPVAWLDLEGTLVLRMDDPGGATNAHLRSWSYSKLGEADWAAIGASLWRRNARMSIGYVAGWVDDGDTARGDLRVAGRAPHRVPGRVYPSPLVKYRDRSGHMPGTLHDYEAEFRGIQALRAAGLGEVELHGYTHIHPDSVSWAKAPDRYEATSWFRELGGRAEALIASRPPDEHPLALGVAALRRYFTVHPTTLICPGDEWTDGSLERALELGLQMVSNSYLALRHEDRFCWTTHVCAAYLEQAGASWFDSGLPVVGYFHDRDAALEGISWIKRWLDSWQAAGARKLMDLRELAAAVGRRLYLEEHEGKLRLEVTSRGAPALVRPLTVILRLPGDRLPSRLPVSLDNRDVSLSVYPLAEGLGRIVLPPLAEPNSTQESGQASKD